MIYKVSECVNIISSCHFGNPCLSNKNFLMAEGCRSCRIPSLRPLGPKNETYEWLSRGDPASMLIYRILMYSLVMRGPSPGLPTKARHRPNLEFFVATKALNS